MITSHFEDLRRLKEYKEKRNLPIRTISEETGLSQGTILRVKNVTMARISLSTLETLCDYFDVSTLSQLIEYFPDQERSTEPAQTNNLSVLPQTFSVAP
ncbi:MAG: helix-turn-helix transcriptional regulator [Chthonomonadales bacterium]